MLKHLAALSLLALPLTVQAAEPPAIAKAPASTPAPENDTKPPVVERRSDTRHSVTVNGRAIGYTATAGTLTLRDPDGKPGASMFYVAYVADREKGEKERPVTFFYNGGPGASTIWLHMASFAPMRVPVALGMKPGSAPKLGPNPQTLLGETDMVFLDMIGTGYSDMFDPASSKAYLGIDQDAATFTQAIRRYVDLNNRWHAPKYLFGESYGTTRSAVTALKLHDAGVELDGIVLMSSILNFAQRAPGMDRMAINQVPTYAATAWYHGKVDRSASLADHVEKARRFASGPYTAALTKGHRLGVEEHDAVVAEMAALTGLSARYLVQSDLRVMPERFRKELMRENGVALGGLDTRFTGFEGDGAGAAVTGDPMDDVIAGPVISNFLAYISRDLGYKTNQSYRVSSGQSMMAIWDWSHRPPLGGRQNALADVALDLAEAMRKNPSMRVLSLNGYYDLSTPFFATEFDLSHMLLPASLQPNLIEKHYESGHMIYLDQKSLETVKRDIAQFMTR